jgi:hypothetical protein
MLRIGCHRTNEEGADDIINRAFDFRGMRFIPAVASGWVLLLLGNIRRLEAFECLKGLWQQLDIRERLQLNQEFHLFCGLLGQADIICGQTHTHEIRAWARVEREPKFSAVGAVIDTAMVAGGGHKQQRPPNS